MPISIDAGSAKCLSPGSVVSCQYHPQKAWGLGFTIIVSSEPRTLFCTEYRNGSTKILKNIADRTSLIDLQHLGRSRVIAAALLESDNGIAIVDPGPSSAIPVLRTELAAAGIKIADVRMLLLTHIHLDHAGACGSLVRENPSIQVVVHERGVRHMADPSRLVASARHVFGDRMDKLWGPFLPVPAGNLRVVNEGDQIAVAEGGRRFDVAYTPGHASHHVSYYEAETGIAYIGDAGGVSVSDGQVVLPTTPPPDIDPDKILASFQRILQWKPERLFLTHFGLVTNAEEHNAQHAERLAAWSGHVQQSLNEAEDDQRLVERFVHWVRADLRRSLDEEDVLACEQGAATNLSWFGLAHYWRNRDVVV